MRNDNELIYLFRQGDEKAFDCLIEAYRPAALSIVGTIRARYPNLLETKDDLLQEMYLGLYEAACRYRDDGTCSFHTFFRTIAMRKALHVVKRNFQTNHYANMNASSLDVVVKEDSSLYRVDTIEQTDVLANPDYATSYNLAHRRFMAVVNHFDAREKKAYELSMAKVSYEEAAHQLGCTPKQYDNLVQKVRRMIKEAVREEA